MSLFSSWIASPPPDAAIEIAADRVAVAVVGERSGGLVVQSYASEALPAGAVVPSLTASNVHNRAAVVSALRAALDRAGARPRRVALVIPDLAAKVSLVRFDTVPARREDLDQFVRWQVKKASPFPIEEALVTYSPGVRGSGGAAEFLVVAARRDAIAEYEAVCDELKIYAGLVDLATLSVVNLFLGGPEVPSGDWLLVHLRPDYTSIVIMRGEHVIFFRNRPEGDEASMADLVHQTAMYYQDRLSGQRFSRVLLGGSGRVTGLEEARRSLEDRLGASVEPVDPTRFAALTDRISVTPDLMDVLGPLVGMAVRTRKDAVSA
ncbi:MAG TPA: pilus assembly protein PilM [Vicinamibacterales bacterium]|nr:pilus assembly protein PilM [Vicinamibacterales bacterium]